MLTSFQKAVMTIALAICFATVFGAEVWRASHAPQAPHQETAAQQQSRSNTPEERPEEAIARYNKFLAWFTGILATATIGLGIGTIFQLRLARAEFISSHPPKLVVREILRLSWGRPNVQLRYVVANVGGSDARIIESHIELQEIKAGSLRPLQPIEGANPVGHITLIPGSHIFREYNSTVSGLSLAVSQLVKEMPVPHFGAERRGVYFRGFVVHRDKNGVRRRTSFCRMYDAESERFYALGDPDYEYAD